MREEVIELTKTASNLIKEFEDYMFENAKEKYISVKGLLDEHKEKIEMIDESIDTIDLESTKNDLERIINAIEKSKKVLNGEEEIIEEEIINNAAPTIDESVFNDETIDNTMEIVNESFENIDVENDITLIPVEENEVIDIAPSEEIIEMPSMNIFEEEPINVPVVENNDEVIDPINIFNEEPTIEEVKPVVEENSMNIFEEEPIELPKENQAISFDDESPIASLLEDDEPSFVENNSIGEEFPIVEEAINSEEELSSDELDIAAIDAFLADNNFNIE